MTGPSLFTVISKNFSDRQKAAGQIKQKVLGNTGTPLNTTVFYGTDLKPEALQEALSILCFEGKRLVMFKEADRLSAQCKAILLEEFKKKDPVNSFFFDIEEDPWQFMNSAKIKKDPFFQYLFSQGTVIKKREFSETLNFFSLTRALDRRQAAAAFYILEKLFLENKNNRGVGMQMLGALVYYASSLPDLSRRKKTLFLIRDTDRLIKEKGVEAQLALEILVTRILAAT